MDRVNLEKYFPAFFNVNFLFTHIFHKGANNQIVQHQSWNKLSRARYDGVAVLSLGFETDPDQRNDCQACEMQRKSNIERNTLRMGKY